ncbi:MAG: helix-turn-helix transcriptional regulator, partial [Lachnospiraceae bacterium]|nr:helix-turn-helix transcriptional regulator [Lachnospiraceae bacterium]
MSQEQFGELLNTSRQTVSKWELDQVIPDIRKIVAISKLFCVSTDSLLLDVTTFAEEGERFLCGVYRGKNMEIVETERIALIYYCEEDRSVISAKAYIGDGKQKTCKAVCERDMTRGLTRYAFENKEGEFVYNEAGLTKMLSERFAREQLARLDCIDKFYVNHGEIELPSVEEAGIKKCLTLWQMGTEYHVEKDYFSIVLNTSQTEYNFSIARENTDIYCGIMYMHAFDLGIQSFGQYFRLRNQGDNSKKYCRFYCDFAYEKPNVQF